MQNKKMYFILTAVVILVAAAAFVGGRFINGQGGSLGFLPFSGGGMTAMSINMLPAPELPTTNPEVVGNFAERKDNAIYVQTFSIDASGAGGVVSIAVDSSGSMDNSGPKVEVVVTNETKIYRDATEFGADPSGENTTIQQVVESGSLDDLTSQTSLTVWGRKNGDRIIAEVLVYSTPFMIEQ